MRPLSPAPLVRPPGQGGIASELIPSACGAGGGDFDDFLECEAKLELGTQGATTGRILMLLERTRHGWGYLFK